MQKELQELINKWKQEADILMTDRDKGNIYARVGLGRLRTCISEAELLLGLKMDNDPPPQLDKHDVSGQSEQLPTLEDAWNAGVNEGGTRANSFEWGIRRKEETFSDWLVNEFEKLKINV